MKKQCIITCDFRVQQGKDYNPENTGYSSSNKVDNMVLELVSKIGTDKLTSSFNLKDIKLKALKKGLILKTYKSGSNNIREGNCSIRRHYDSKNQRMSIHILDVENGVVNINYYLVFILGTNKVLLHPSFSRGCNYGLLEELGIVKKMPQLPELPEKIVIGEMIPTLTSTEESQRLFLFSEIKERFNKIQNEYRILKNSMEVP